MMDMAGSMHASEAVQRILFIVGSLRKGSFNRQLSQHAAAMFKGKAEVSDLDWREVPVFCQDIEFPEPPSVGKVRRAVQEADALWIFAPEYNHGVPGPLKNLIDWLSRALEDGSPGVIMGKTCTVSGVAGSSCARHSFAALQPTLSFLELRVAPVQFTGMSFDRAMVESGELRVDEGVKASLQAQAEGLLAEIAKRKIPSKA